MTKISNQLKEEIIEAVLYNGLTPDEAAEASNISKRSVYRVFKEAGVPVPNSIISPEWASLIYEAGRNGITSGKDIKQHFTDMNHVMEVAQNDRNQFSLELAELDNDAFAKFLSGIFNLRTKKQLVSALKDISKNIQS